MIIARRASAWARSGWPPDPVPGGQLTSGQLSESSPEFARLEADFLRQQTDLEAYRKVQQREFLKRRAARLEASLADL